ncbi:hypothetical protein ACM66B_005897 [Microbotryomycetes sp. NB124-2]
MQPFVICIIVLVGALVLSTLFATLIFARWQFRRSASLRSSPVDKAHEAKLRAQAAVAAHEYEEANKSTSRGVLNSGEETSRPPSYVENLDLMRKSMFSGYYGVTPVSQEGPGGTRTYLNGWFGLDAPGPELQDTKNLTAYAPTNTSLEADEAQTAVDATHNVDHRETHFSRATRASLRRNKQYKDEQEQTKEQTKGVSA